MFGDYDDVHMLGECYQPTLADPELQEGGNFWGLGWGRHKEELCAANVNIPFAHRFTEIYILVHLNRCYRCHAV